MMNHGKPVIFVSTVCNKASAASVILSVHMAVDHVVC